MKNLVLAFLACVSFFPLHAENWLENGDFANGLDHWRGNGRSPADMAPSDPFAKPDPLLSTGLIIPLHERGWTQITQNFRTKAAQLVLTVSVIFSPDVVFSDRDEDYTNVPDKINNRLYRTFDVNKHQWIALFTDFGNASQGVYYTFDPETGSAEVQNFRADVNSLSPLEDELITLAFPPGKGNVILRNVSLSGK